MEIVSRIATTVKKSLFPEPRPSPDLTRRNLLFAKQTNELLYAVYYTLLAHDGNLANKFDPDRVDHHLQCDGSEKAYRSLLGACNEFCSLHGDDLSAEVADIDMSDAKVYDTFLETVLTIFNEINWGRMVSAICLSKTMAVRAINEGRLTLVESILGWLQLIFLDKLQSWVLEQGNWVAFPDTFKQEKRVSKVKFQDHLERAAAKGTLTTRLSSLGILGAAGTGKTSIKKLLTYQKPDDVYSSTPVLETEKYIKKDSQASEDGGTHPSSKTDEEKFGWDSDHEDQPLVSKPSQSQMVKPASRDRIISSVGKVWCPVTQETLLERITKCVEMVAKQQDGSSSVTGATGLVPLEGFSMKKRKADPTMIPHVHKSNLTKDSVNNGASADSNQATSSEYNEVAKLILDFATLENLKQLGITHFVSVSDTGGQAAFLDVAPFLLNFNSVNLILLKLNERLEDPAQFFYTIDGVKVGDETRQISTKSLIHSFVSSKSKIEKPRIKGIKVAKPYQKPMFMILGTHFDVYKEMDSQDPMFESKDEKNESLKSDLSAFKNCIYANGNKMMFSLDTRARDDDTLKLASQIRKLVMENYVQAEIPVAWYIFELAMDKAADSNEGMIYLSTLAKIGAAISEMPLDEVEAALVYFHNLQVCLFYPEVVPNVVFTNPQYLFDRISEIIAFSYGSGKIGVTDEEFKSLTKHGKFRIGLLDVICKPFKECFSSKDFLDLLDHLFIISSLPDTDEYFMPCVLAEHPNPCEGFINTLIQVEPLLLTWPDKSVPNGLFPSLSTNIQARNGFNGIHFKMSGDQQYRNRITLACHDLGCEVVLIECDTFVGIAVHSTCLQQIPSTCVKIRGAILRCIEVIVERFDGRWSPSLAFPEEVFICKIQPECRADRTIHFCYSDVSHKVISCEMESSLTVIQKDSHTIWWSDGPVTPIDISTNSNKTAEVILSVNFNEHLEKPSGTRAQKNEGVRNPIHPSTIEGSLPPDTTAYNILLKYRPQLLKEIGHPNMLAIELVAEGLLSPDTQDSVSTTTGINRYDRASMIVDEVVRFFEHRKNDQENFLKFCQVLKDHEQPGLDELAEEMEQLVLS